MPRVFDFRKAQRKVNRQAPIAHGPQLFAQPDTSITGVSAQPNIPGGIIAYFASPYTIELLNQEEAPPFKTRLPLIILITTSIFPFWMPLVLGTPVAIPAIGYTFGFTTIFAVMSCVFIYSRFSQKWRSNR